MDMNKKKLSVSGQNQCSPCKVMRCLPGFDSRHKHKNVRVKYNKLSVSGINDLSFLLFSLYLKLINVSTTMRKLKKNLYLQKEFQ